jgi:hypothetical protein
MGLPLILAGPILRRVEPTLVSVWIALREPCTVKLSLWEGTVKAGEGEAWLSEAVEGVQAIGTRTMRFGDKLHLTVVSLKIDPAIAPAKVLLPDRNYSYNLTLESESGSADLKSLGLLKNEPVEGKDNLALGYEPDFLPSFALPPLELTNLRLVHGSCRRPGNAHLDAQVWVDDLIVEARKDMSTYALKRPHQLLLTGDQIYADDVMRLHLDMLMDAAKELIGSTPDASEDLVPIEKLTVGGKSWPSDQNHFPPGARENFIWHEALMTTTDGDNHLISFGEFCAMYLFVWSNGCWPATDDWPEMSHFLPPYAWLGLMPASLLKHLLPPVKQGEEGDFENRRRDYQKALRAPASVKALERSYKGQLKNLKQFYRGLPKVRRSLANVPTYMMFDDHEVTDDWNLNPMWRDRVYGSQDGKTLGKTILRNGILSYALFQGWGNDPVKFAEGDKHKQLLEQATKLFPAGAATSPDDTEAAEPPNAAAGAAIDLLFGFDGNDPPVKWHYSVPGQKHVLLALDNRTRRSYVSRIGPPGNISDMAQVEQLAIGAQSATFEVLVVMAPLPVLGPPIFDEVIAPLTYRVFDLTSYSKLQEKPGTKGMAGTNPDAIEAWAFDAKTFEKLLARLATRRQIVLLSGDVHYAASNGMSYWKKGDREPARFAQFTSSGLKNVMPWYIAFISRSLGFAQKLIRAKIGIERMGWNSTSPEPLRFTADAKVAPTLRTKLKQSPVMIPTEGWPEGTTINPAHPPDWSWRLDVVRDTRKDSERPAPARPEPLDPASPEADVSLPDGSDTETGSEAYRRIAARHALQLERFNNSRQILFASNLGVVRFEKREVSVAGAPTIITDAIHELYSTHPEADEPERPELYTRHVVPLRNPLEKRPEETFSEGGEA